MLCPRGLKLQQFLCRITHNVDTTHKVASCSQALFSNIACHTANSLELTERKLGTCKRKPLVTSINELKRRERQKRLQRQEVHEITLRPPENGLLVKRLIPVAREVYNAQKQLFSCVSRVVAQIPVHVCRVCSEVHVGKIPHCIRTCDVVGSLPSKEHCWVKGGVKHVLPIVESFHLYDRLGRAVSHEERLLVDRIPAVMELCIQAGVDVPEYPTKRRSFPVYNVAGKMIDFERKYPRDYTIGKDITPFGFWERKLNQNFGDNPTPCSSSFCLTDIAKEGMDSWEKMRTGIAQLLTKYPAQTCGYCPEVQVGPKGHRARICQAYKHQMRDGQHAWQEASIDDLVPPVYVWHVADAYSSTPLQNELRRYYGKLPAVLELFSQAGIELGERYENFHQVDIAVPGLGEEKFVV